MNNNSNGPLMYINTAQTNSDFKSGQETFDSRYVVIEEKKIVKNEYTEKLEKVVKLYNKNTPVLCLITMEDESLECIPFAIDDYNVSVIVNDSTKDISLETITDFMIIKF